MVRLRARSEDRGSGCVHGSCRRDVRRDRSAAGQRARRLHVLHGRESRCWARRTDPRQAGLLSLCSRTRAGVLRRGFGPRLRRRCRRRERRTDVSGLVLVCHLGSGSRTFWFPQKPDCRCRAARQSSAERCGRFHVPRVGRSVNVSSPTTVPKAMTTRRRSIRFRMASRCRTSLRAMSRCRTSPSAVQPPIRGCPPARSRQTATTSTPMSTSSGPTAGQPITTTPGPHFRTPRTDHGCEPVPAHVRSDAHRFRQSSGWLPFSSSSTTTTSCTTGTTTRVFDEAAGNAQASNFGRGGVEGDSMKAEGQDFSGRNNANMSTPADGGRPRMQMYVFDANVARAT